MNGSVGAVGLDRRRSGQKRPPTKDGKTDFGAWFSVRMSGRCNGSGGGAKSRVEPNRAADGKQAGSRKWRLSIRAFRNWQRDSTYAIMDRCRKRSSSMQTFWWRVSLVQQVTTEQFCVFACKGWHNQSSVRRYSSNMNRSWPEGISMLSHLSPVKNEKSFSPRSSVFVNGFRFIICGDPICPMKATIMSLNSRSRAAQKLSSRTM